MSGLFGADYGPLAKMVSAMGVPHRVATFERHWIARSVSCPGSIDPPSAPSVASPASAGRVILPISSSGGLFVGLSGCHQLPGDAGGLVGQRHGGELGRLALQELDQPEPALAKAGGEGFRPLPRRVCQMTAVAPTTSRLRKVSSPARVIAPSFCLPAVEWSLGVRPSQAANCRPEPKACGSGVFITSSEAMTGPIVGIAASRRDRSLARYQATSLASIATSSVSSRSYSRPSPANSARARAG